MGSVMKALGRRGRRRFKRKSKVKKIESKVKALSKAVKGEQRFLSSAQPLGTQIVTGGTFLLLNGMQQGDGDGSREGNKIVINRIECRGLIYLSPAAATTSSAATTLRLMLVFDKAVPQTAGAGAAWTPAEMLDNAATNQNNAISCMRFSNRDRFRILYDRTKNIKPSANTRAAVGVGQYEQGDWAFRIVKRFKRGVTVNYNTGNAGTIADLAKNSLYLVAFADNSTETYIWCRCHIYYTP